MFKTNKEMENEGVDLDFGNGIKFRVRRYHENNPKMKAARAKYYKPYARLIEMDKLPQDKDREIIIKLFVSTSLIGWEGVEIDGELAEFTPDNAIRLFKELPDLFDTVSQYAINSENFKEDLGNS